MKHKILYKLNRIRYYLKLLIWARKHSKRVSSYKFLLELKIQSHENMLKAEREQKTYDKNKAIIQEELLNKILNEITI